MRTITDSNFMQWTAFVSTGKQGYSNDPHFVFQCMSQPTVRPRWTPADGDESDAQAALVKMSASELQGTFERSVDLP